LIEKVLSALEAKLADRRTPFPAAFVAESVDFLVEYADRFHHFKEEESLFPLLAERGVPVEGGPIGVMLHEHTVGRSLLAAIRDRLPAAQRGDETAGSEIAASAQRYIELLRQHIWKEDNVLFQMAHRVLNEADLRTIGESFARGGTVSGRRLEQLRAFAGSV
jgi:hemerythrin-like domain-containing protein